MTSFSFYGAVRAACLLGLVLLGGATAPIAHALQDHGGHEGHSGHGAATEKPGGDPYLLDVDPVSGESLGPVANQVIVNHEGRELRFSSRKNADLFAAAPDKYLAALDRKMVEQQSPYYPLEVCVVSGDKLSKKDAIDFVYRNRLVRVSKAEHKATFLKESAPFLEKLDKAVIEKQKPKYKVSTCVVSGEKLGEMGDPIDRVVGNRLVRLCCKGCVKNLDKDPLTYLAKVDAEGKDNGANDKSGKDGGKALSYTCPMHSDVLRTEAGRCPKCGMDLVKK